MIFCFLQPTLSNRPECKPFEMTKENWYILCLVILLIYLVLVILLIIDLAYCIKQVRNGERDPKIPYFHIFIKNVSDFMTSITEKFKKKKEAPPLPHADESHLQQTWLISSSLHLNESDMWNCLKIKKTFTKVCNFYINLTFMDLLFTGSIYSWETVILSLQPIKL